ncbi:serine hydrolase [Kribbella sp. NPDC056861]|uniref:serine hydrolase n=1 Tax=Kribbella sp. NPDC056861 TaxID=3154857 RepID=UPI0034295908
MTARIRAAFDDAGARGWLHAISLDHPDQTVDLDPDVVVPIASVYKLPLLAAYCHLVDTHHLDPREQLTLQPADRIPGATGLSIFHDPVTLSLRDLAVMMMTVSDNAAADALLNKVGEDRLSELLRSFGLHHTSVRRGAASNLSELRRRTGASDVDAAFAVLADNDQTDPVGVYDAAGMAASTPRDMTTLLASLWTGQLLSAEQTAFVQKVMQQQVFSQRIASGFPYDGVRVAGKTGTFGALRHEAGVVVMPGGDAYAVAVFTHAARGDQRLPRVDAAIGEAARLAVDQLR